jgi:hypothetical protein
MEEARSVKRFLTVAAAMAGVAMLSSCGFSQYYNGTTPGVQDRAEQIAEAITRQDADALKGLFSARALEEADDIDAQLEYLLSLFPTGSEVSYELNGINAPREVSGGEKWGMVRAVFKLTADGEDFWMFFAENTEDTRDPDNLGLYGLGVAPRTESQDSDAELAMFEWNGQFDLGEGTPGVYVPAS